MATIYVNLLDEGTDCWRPVEAKRIGGNVFLIVSANPDPEDERWEFNANEQVLCRDHIFSDGAQGLVAYALAASV